MQQSSATDLRETVIAGALATLLLLVVSWPAFKYFFFGEAFWALRIYHEHNGNLWGSAFSRIDGMFFRPGFFFALITWDFVLPADALIYHLRNFLFCAANLFLLHRVLLRFVRTRPPRIVALGMFAASKIYLTVIGYINIFEVSILLMTMLLTVLFFSRYIDARRPSDYLMAFLFCAFNVYCKDNGFIVIGILAAMILAVAIRREGSKNQINYWTVRFLPFVIISASNQVLRYILIGPINRDNPIYSPRLSFPVAVRQTTAFLATVGNFSLTRSGSMGLPGLSGVLAGNSKVIEFALCAALWLLIVYTVWQGRSAWRLMIVPLAWIALYLSPTFLIRNHQVYYFQEPLVGAVILIAISLDRAKRPRFKTWFAVIALIAINGFISGRRSYYDWEYTADRAAVVKPLIASQKIHPPESIIITTPPNERDFWFFALREPLVSHLLGSPTTSVNVVNRQDATTLPDKAPTAQTVLFDVEQGIMDASRLRSNGSTSQMDLPPGHNTQATITANPNPIRVCDGSGLGTTTIFYAFDPQFLMEVHVNSPTGDLFAKTAASGSSSTGKWVSDGMTFFLQNVTNGRPLTTENTVSSVTVKVTTSGCQ
jgi:hypothetical protein